MAHLFDPTFCEAEAPMYRDFEASDLSDISDSWFDKQNENDLSKTMNVSLKIFDEINKAPSSFNISMNERKALGEIQLSNTSVECSASITTTGNKASEKINIKISLSQNDVSENNYNQKQSIQYEVIKSVNCDVPKVFNDQSTNLSINAAKKAPTVNKRRSSSCSRINALKKSCKLTVPQSPLFSALHSTRTGSHKKCTISHKETESKRQNASVASSRQASNEQIFFAPKSTLSSQNTLPLRTEKLVVKKKNGGQKMTPNFHRPISAQKWTPTVCKPFNFRTDDVHQKLDRRMKEKIEQDAKLRKQLSEFHAKPASVLTHAPFKPQHFEHNKTVPMALNLKTDTRAKERDVFDQHLKEKEQQEAENDRLKRQEEEKIEREQLKDYRKQIVHKAQPVRHYTNVPPRPNPKSTVPETPNFQTKSRATSRKHSANE